MAACRSETIHQIYLDWRKAYDFIDKNRILSILEEYKVGRCIFVVLFNFFMSVYLCVCMLLFMFPGMYMYWCSTFIYSIIPI